jgi:uncharacterized alkaline shock family protein YloU
MEDKKSLGNIEVNNEVIANIAGTAATEIDGVFSMCGNVKNGIAEFFGKKDFSKGVMVKLEGNVVSITLSIVVNYGVSIPKIAYLVQNNVKNKIEDMIGLQVQEVNVNVKWVQFADSKK